MKGLSALRTKLKQNKQIRESSLSPNASAVKQAPTMSLKHAVMYILQSESHLTAQSKNNDPTGELSGGTDSTEVKRCLAVEGRKELCYTAQAGAGSPAFAQRAFTSTAAGTMDRSA